GSGHRLEHDVAPRQSGGGLAGGLINNLARHGECLRPALGRAPGGENSQYGARGADRTSGSNTVTCPHGRQPPSILARTFLILERRPPTFGQAVARCAPTGYGGNTPHERRTTWCRANQPPDSTDHVGSVRPLHPPPRPSPCRRLFRSGGGPSTSPPRRTPRLRSQRRRPTNDAIGRQLRPWRPPRQTDVPDSLSYGPGRTAATGNLHRPARPPRIMSASLGVPARPSRRL